MTQSVELRRDAARNRDRIIAAAVEVFSEEGTDAGVERIASRAGVGVGTLYRRFPTKEALIRSLVKDMMSEVVDAAATARDVPAGRGLEEFTRTVAQGLAAHRGLLNRLWKREQAESGQVADLRRHVDRLIRDARAAGAIRPEVKREDVNTLLWSLHGVIDNAGPDALARCLRLVDVFWAGLRPPPGSRSDRTSTVRPDRPDQPNL
jgi:AcrR family transcriptional regulator